MSGSQLAGRGAIVTGGASGIGEAVTRRFVEEGARVLVADVDSDRGKRLAEELDGVEFLETDVSQHDAVVAMVTTAQQCFGRLDILVNNAFWTSMGRTHKMPVSEWRRTLEVTLDAVFYGMRAALPVFLEQGRGAIVNTASICGLGGDDGMSAYNTAKAGVINLTRAVALESAARGVRANCVCPGLIATPAVERGFLNQPERREQIGARIPMQRLGEAEEIANVVLFLASDQASYVTGAAFVADGGSSIGSGVPNLIA